MAKNISPALGLEERLEKGEVITFPICPFPVPGGDDRAFLVQQQLGGSAHKNISYDPLSSKAHGYRKTSLAQEQRLRGLLADFSNCATTWLASLLPRYAAAWRLDRATFRPEEEATRKLRLTARNDLLHIDAFPSRPTQGDRILRLFVNLHPADARVWVTSRTFRELLARYGEKVGLPAIGHPGLVWRIGQEVLRLFQPEQPRRSVYDWFMLRFHHFLKHHEEFQDSGWRQFWNFAPGSAWLLFSDSVSHAELRGRYALEHSFFVARSTLAVPEEAPAAILERACGTPVLDRAA